MNNRQSDGILSGGGGIFSIREDIQEQEPQEFRNRQQYIGCLVGEEEFLLPIQAVSEIMMLRPITYVPKALKNIEGVLNIRGSIIPTVSMRKIIGVPALAAPSASNRIVIVKHEDYLAGLIVDGITRVEALLPSEIEDHGMASRGISVDIMSSLSKKLGKVRGILDILKIVTLIAGGKLAGGEKSEGEQEAPAA